MTKRIWMGALLSACVALTMTAHARWATRAGAADVPGEMAANEFGVAESVHRSGLIDRSNPFFLELGVNGRTCASCHDGRAGWTITPTFARQLFNASDGLAPLFRIHETNPAILANVIKIGSGLCGARLRHPIGGISLVNTAFVA